MYLRCSLVGLPGSRLGLPAVLALAVSAAQSLAAQTIDLKLVADSAGTPVVGAIVRLIGTGVVFQGLTDESGRIVIRARDPGSYRLRIDRIGGTGLTSETFSLEAGQTLQRVIPLVSTPFRLPPIEVRATLRCESPGPHSDAAITLWEEVQKALTAQVITTAIGLPLHFRRFVREVDFGGRTLREWVNASQISKGAPFQTLAPGDLARKGFAYTMGDTAVFAAPDAALLLSAEFVSTHCFFAREDRPGLAGLRFVPMAGRRVPEVTGTLWLDRETAQLRSLDFSYSGLPAGLRRLELGGRIEFTLTSGGRWIVSHWYVRMPRMTSLRTSLRPSVAGYTDNGGYATIASDTSRIPHLSVLSGRVYDSTAGRGLAGAIASLQDRTHLVTTDTAGRFQMFFPFAGPVRVVVNHPKLGLLGEATIREVVLSLDDTTFTEFAVPPLDAFVRATCSKPPLSGRVHIVGSARTQDDSPPAGREVLATKRVGETNVPIRGVKSARVSRTGTFGVCNVPAHDTVHVTLRAGKTILADSLVILGRQTRWVDLRS